MTRLYLLIISAALLALTACSGFPEKYENVIRERKIRPFGIVLESPEAAPGDTVDVYLRMYDAGKPHNVEWTLALDYNITNYGALANTGLVLDMDTMMLNPAYGDDQLHFQFVVPEGEKNPLLVSSLIPRILVPREELSRQEIDGFEQAGIPVGDRGLKSSALIGFLEEQDEIPGMFAPMIDGLVSLVVLNAKVTSANFTLDIEKKLSVRYSNRLQSGNRISNVNRNPPINSIGIISVREEGLKDPDRIHEFEADTQYFSMNASNQDDPAASVVDTFFIRDNRSYFLMADSTGAAQKYLSPDQQVHTEQLFYQWFYTNEDKTDSEWEDLIEIGSDESDASLPVVYLQVPADKSMKRFTIRATAGDWRPEWALLTSAGLGYLKVSGYFRYE